MKGLSLGSMVISEGSNDEVTILKRSIQTQNVSPGLAKLKACSPRVKDVIPGSIIQPDGVFNSEKLFRLGQDCSGSPIPPRDHQLSSWPVSFLENLGSQKLTQSLEDKENIQKESKPESVRNPPVDSSSGNDSIPAHFLANFGSLELQKRQHQHHLNQKLTGIFRLRGLLVLLLVFLMMNEIRAEDFDESTIVWYFAGIMVPEKYYNKPSDLETVLPKNKLAGDQEEKTGIPMDAELVNLKTKDLVDKNGVLTKFKEDMLDGTTRRGFLKQGVPLGTVAHQINDQLTIEEYWNDGRLVGRDIRSETSLRFLLGKVHSRFRELLTTRIKTVLKQKSTSIILSKKGQTKFIYFGEALNGERSGEGLTIIYEAGNVCDSHYKNDKFHGPTKNYFYNGYKNEGINLWNLRHGIWNVESSTGETQNQAFKEGKKLGIIKFIPGGYLFVPAL